MTDPTSAVQGYPVLVMASREAPYRTVLAPPREYGVDGRRIGTMLASAVSATAEEAPVRAGFGLVEHDGHPFTMVYRDRQLDGVEVGIDGEALDRSSRPIRVLEGVVVAGWWDVDADAVLAAGAAQINEAIREFWADHTKFEQPRPAELVTFPVRSAVGSAGARSDDQPAEPVAAVPSRPDAVDAASARLSITHRRRGSVWIVVLASTLLVLLVAVGTVMVAMWPEGCADIGPESVRPATTLVAKPDGGRGHDDCADSAGRPTAPAERGQ